MALLYFSDCDSVDVESERYDDPDVQQEMARLVHRGHNEDTLVARNLSKVMYCLTFIVKFYLSYDVAVFQWVTPCRKNRMTTRVLTLLREYAT